VGKINWSLVTWGIGILIVVVLLMVLDRFRSSQASINIQYKLIIEKQDRFWKG
jgi:hypothetical protein